METYALLIAATLNAGTVLAIAALGLLINEKAGVVNLGAEGMMLCAAIAGFAAVVHTGSDLMGFLAGMGAGALLGAVVRGQEVLMAHHDLVLESEDHLIVFVTEIKTVQKIEKLLQVSASFFG